MIDSIFIFLLGLIFGSFISALSYRYPRGISIAKGRSFCPNCKKKIAWFDNIPLLSFILLGGKCRNCRKPISWRYPLIELLTGLGFLFIGWNLYLLVLFVLLVSIFVIDSENQIIPDDFVFFGIVVTILYFLLNTEQAIIFNGLLSGLLAATLLMLIHLFTGGRGMGLGDVKFAVLGGMIVGLNLMLIWLFSSFLTGGLVGIILILAKKAGLKDKIAFGPFLVFGIFITLLWGEKILRLLI